MSFCSYPGILNGQIKQELFSVLQTDIVPRVHVNLYR